MRSPLVFLGLASALSVFACSSQPLTSADAGAGNAGAGTPGTGAAGSTVTGGAGTGSAGTDDTGAAGSLGLGGVTGAAGTVAIAHPLPDGGAGSRLTPTPDAAPSGDAPDASHAETDASDAASSDGDECPPLPADASVPAACRLTPVPSPSCAVTPVAIAPASLCPGAASCPATAELQLRCEGTSNPGLSLAALSDGAVLLEDEITAGGDIDMNLFTLHPGADSQVQHFPSLYGGVIAVDGAQKLDIFVGDQPGIWRLHQTSQGWVREDVARATSDLPDYLGGARVLGDDQAFVAFGDGGGIGATLSRRDGVAWHTSSIPTVSPTEGTQTDGALSLDLDASGKPWVVCLGSHADDDSHYFVDVVGPDGVVDTVFREPDAQAENDPVILAGGLTGADAHPAVAFWSHDGAHVATFTASGWQSPLVPGSAPLTIDNDTCPARNGSECPRASCTAHATGAASGLGLARTTSGHTYVAWLDIATTTTDTFCATGAPISQTGSATLVVSRVTGDPTTPFVSQRFHFDAAAAVGRMTMVARGDTLAVVMSLGSDLESTDLRYLELDSTRLP